MIKLKKNIFKIFTILILFLAFVILYKNISTRILGKKYVNVLGYTYDINKGNFTFIKVTDDVRSNDRIYYNKGSNKETVLIKINNGSYITKAENIKKNNVIGKVLYKFNAIIFYILVIVFIVIYVLFIIFNRKEIFYREKSRKNRKDLPDDIFKNSKNNDSVPGLTVTISLKDMDLIDKDYTAEDLKQEENVEILNFDNYLDLGSKDHMRDEEKDTIDIVLSILKCRNSFSKSRINNPWLKKYQYVYKLNLLLLNGNYDDFVNDVNNPIFEEVFDYDLERIGLTKIIRNRIYDLEVYGILRLLVYSILYNDEVLFDGIFKILKYKVKVDSKGDFFRVKKSDLYTIKELKSLQRYMREITYKFDNKNVFELSRIDKLIKIKNY